MNFSVFHLLHKFNFSSKFGYLMSFLKLLCLQIMRNAAEMLIPVTLELGGKDAFIVCEDADVEHVRIFPTFTSVL